jgi:hypothetical protein
VDTTALHDERLWPSVGTWLVVPLLAVGVAVSLLPLGTVAAVVGVVVAVSLAVTGFVLAAAPVRVAGGELVAGPARIPVALLGAAEPLRDEQARHARGPGLDARAYLLLRGWVHPMVRVAVQDAQDPTPYWLVSTRRPEQLALAIATARTAATPAEGAGGAGSAGGAAG